LLNFLNRQQGAVYFIFLLKILTNFIIASTVNLYLIKVRSTLPVFSLRFTNLIKLETWL